MANYIVCTDGVIETKLSREEVLRRLGDVSSVIFDAGDFGKVLDDILENRITEESEIDTAIASLGSPVYRYYSFLIARAAPEIPCAQLCEGLEKLFPNAPITQRGDLAVLLLGCNDDRDGLYPSIERDELTALFTKLGAVAAISTMNLKRTALHSMYDLTERTLALGTRLHTDRRRLFHFEEYAEYIVIDMCAQTFTAKHGGYDLIPLTHPTVAYLFFLDIKNDDNLTEVLYHYCLNNCNIAQTAASAYMHRNTIAAKLAKIRSLVTLDLSSVALQQRVIFSYHVLHYMEHYLDARVSTFFNIKP